MFYKQIDESKEMSQMAQEELLNAFKAIINKVCCGCLLSDMEKEIGERRKILIKQQNKLKVYK